MRKMKTKREKNWCNKARKSIRIGPLLWVFPLGSPVFNAGKLN